MENRKMPIGIDDFTEIIREGFYYVDKTGMIKELLRDWGKVNLFTRPRRFGKSINMSMLQSYFEIGTDKNLFDGLDISKEVELCEKYMGKFPVIAISLKQVSGNTFEEARSNLWEQIMAEADRFSFMAGSDKLSIRERENLRKLCEGSGNLHASLKQLSDILYKYYNHKTIIIIDEYDAPLQKAYENNYYSDMVELIRQMFGYALKSNNSLYFSVLTGCMRVTYSGTSTGSSAASLGKESLFSDLNNPTMYTLVDETCDEWFGFTDQEVRKLLDDYGLGEYYGITKEWYDGYRIGAADIYCPWDVINWCRQLLTTSDKKPRNYWSNVSGNEIIYRFIDKAGDSTRYDLEVLSEGNTVDKALSFELTYKDIYSGIDNLWSVLFTTGYLTQRGQNEDGTYRLAIPNREIRQAFANQIQKWFLVKIEGGLQELYQAFDDGNAEKIEACLNNCMKESISFMDGGNTEEEKEAGYHMMLIGMAQGRKGWVIKSNREAGKGRADIIIINRMRNDGIVIEVKYTVDEQKLTSKAVEACKQIEEMCYQDYFRGFKIDKVEKYGIAFCGKECRVVNG